MPQSTEASNRRSCPAWALIFTLSVKVNTSCYVSTETSRLFPRIPWGQCLALNISWLLRSSNKMCQIPLLAHNIHFLAPWSQIPYLVWTKGQKEKSQDLICFLDLGLKVSPHASLPQYFPGRCRQKLLYLSLNVYFWCESMFHFAISQGPVTHFFASFRTLIWQNQSHEKKVETS